MKHLNPRQGITTSYIDIREPSSPLWLCETPKSPPGDYNRQGVRIRCGDRRHRRVKHLNPRQGITTAVEFGQLHLAVLARGVKHLNPRQGITTPHSQRARTHLVLSGVKHLNPRQGITTAATSGNAILRSLACETPKSPPGDYNNA